MRLSLAVPDPRFGSLLSAVALFFVPTFFSGMVSPYAVRLLVQDRNSSGRHAGQLYFVSTFGSAAGTLLTSFYLVLLAGSEPDPARAAADLGRDRRLRLVRARSPQRDRSMNADRSCCRCS